VSPTLLDGSTCLTRAICWADNQTCLCHLSSSEIVTNLTPPVFARGFIFVSNDSARVDKQQRPGECHELIEPIFFPDRCRARPRLNSVRVALEWSARDGEQSSWEEPRSARVHHALGVRGSELQMALQQGRSLYRLLGEGFMSDKKGIELRFGPGDVAFFPAGTNATWRHPDHFRKVVLKDSIWRPLAYSLKAWNKFFLMVGLSGKSLFYFLMAARSSLVCQ